MPGPDARWDGRPPPALSFSAIRCSGSFSPSTGYRGGDRETARHHRPIWLLPSYVEVSSDHASAIIHDLKPYPPVHPGRPLDPHPVVPDDQGTLTFSRKKPYQDLPGMTVLDGVVHRFLRNVIQVRRYPRVMHKNRLVALEPAHNPKQIPDFPGVEIG